MSEAEFHRVRGKATTSERHARVSPDVMALKSTANLFGEPLFYPPTRHTALQQKQAPTNGLLEELWSLFFVQKLLGIFPYDVSPTGKLVFKLESTTTLYSGIFLAAVSVATVLTLRERFGRLWLRESSLEGFILETNLSSAFTALILFQFVHVAEIWKRIEFINSWGIFLEEFSRVTGKTMGLGLRRRARVSVAMIVVISVLGSIGFGVMDTRVSWWQYPISVFGGMLLTMTPILWHLLCRAIVSAAKTLALEVEQSFSQHGADRVDALAEFKFLWLRLSKVTQGLGNCLGLTYGNFTLFSFGLVVSTSYGFLVSLRGGCTVFTHSLLCSSAFFSAMLYSQCASAQSATDEVGSHFQGRLQALLQNYPHVSSSILVEMDRFLAMINSNPPVIKFSGFVEVNRGLITSLMSQTLTYLIVLMQINISSNSEEFANSTRTSIASSA